MQKLGLSEQGQLVACTSGDRLATQGLWLLEVAGVRADATIACMVFGEQGRREAMHWAKQEKVAGS